MLPRRTLAGFAAPLLLTALVASACSSSQEAASAPTTTAPRSECAPKSGEKAAKALLRCSESSIAFVENQDATGTGVVIDRDGNRYVLTNSHVVDPFDSADISVGGERFDAVPVIGIDAGADIAVVGPLEGDHLPSALPIDRDAAVERGDDVYLVGFPGEVSNDDPEDLEVTIARGIISRTREVKAFEQRYFQTDASIAGGQSGGPLFDERGHLIGISGLSFAENEFALALSGEDVDDAVSKILDGNGDDYLAVPRTDEDNELAKDGTFVLADASTYRQLFIPASKKQRTLEFTVDHADVVAVDMTTNVSDSPLAMSRSTPLIAAELQKLVAAERGGTPDDLPDPTAMGIDEKAMKPETSPGVFSVEIPADEDVYIGVQGPLLTEPLTVSFTSSLGVVDLSGDRPEGTIGIGDVIERVISTYEDAADYELTLEAGDEVEIRAESPQSDVALVIFEPGVALTPVVNVDLEGSEGVELVDDSDEGLYGLDAVTTISAKEGGTYRIRLFSNDAVTVLARLSVTE